MIRKILEGINELELQPARGFKKKPDVPEGEAGSGDFTLLVHRVGAAGDDYDAWMNYTTPELAIHEGPITADGTPQFPSGDSYDEWRVEDDEGYFYTGSEGTYRWDQDQLLSSVHAWGLGYDDDSESGGGSEYTQDYKGEDWEYLDAWSYSKGSFKVVMVYREADSPVGEVGIIMVRVEDHQYALGVIVRDIDELKEKVSQYL